MPTPLISPDIKCLNPPQTSDCAIEQEMLDHGTLTGEDLNIMMFSSNFPSLWPNFHSMEALMNAVDHFTKYNAATSTGAYPLTAYQVHRLPPDPEQHALEHQLEQIIDDVCHEATRADANNNTPEEPDMEMDINIDHMDDSGDPDDTATPLNVEDNKDEPDPFLCEEALISQHRDLSEHPPHLLVINALTSWLHLQFHLPRVACNALLTILTLVLILTCPLISTPFVTLQSSNCLLGLSKPVHLLPVCPSCCNVFPQAGSPHCQDTCMACNTNTFLPSQMKHGNQCSLKTLVVTYHYLPLSEQIKSLLQIPGLETILDAWYGHAHNPGKYIDIFNGAICHTRLKGPDSKLFFLNEDEKQGPNRELCLGVNLGVDWFSYIHSNIAPSHLSCPTSFSICNLPPEYWTSNLMCTSILPSPKEQNPDQIQCFLRPIISNLLHLRKYGIKVPMELCPEGCIVCVILVAVICDKPAAHKMGGFASHSHTNFCTTCWILLNNKDKEMMFQKGAFKPQTNQEQCNLSEHYHKLMNPTQKKNFVKEHATCYTQLAHLPYFNLIDQIIIDPMHNLFLGLVKMHFYNIWIQRKILRPNHELAKLHEMLADFTIPGSCGKLQTDIRMPYEGSLMADQWLLLSTVHGPIIIEAKEQQEVTHKAVNKKALEDAKKLGKEAFDTEHAHVTRENLAISKMEKQEKLQQVVVKQAEKVRLSATKKALKKQKATSQMVADHPEGQVQPQLPPPCDIQLGLSVPLDEGELNTEDDKFSLHPDNPINFLKLSMALRILIK
ncbi:hypothetical protein PAXRUDRAFT_36357 [Paxillus rubicundulus Ve08.2h10]|uniref:Unplaced genomic scaffold scaffold_1370, whole genome shotgun sequence n=1 Tax=Paxillus rubicundulus Ve08.2h10 TaxID=930991 RepID=A0A0D0D7R6_9AGAM|nr:hypothetical protein PAXRUDRAFT_36357 [Paxillus rubicundulus Ve08.2h10]